MAVKHVVELPHRNAFEISANEREGVVGGWVFRRFGVTSVDQGWLGHVFVSVIGGILVVAAVRLLRRVA